MIEFFSDDTANPSSVKAELALWCSHFSDSSLPDTPQAAFDKADPLMFPNVRMMPIRVMVLLVTSHEAEWSLFRPSQGQGQAPGGDRFWSCPPDAEYSVV